MQQFLEVEAGERAPQRLRRRALDRADESTEKVAALAGDDPRAVHDLRRRLKELRALTLILSDSLPARGKAERDFFRDAGRKLATARDSKAAVEAFDRLREHFKDEWGPRQFLKIRRALAEIRAMLMDLSDGGEQSPRSAERLWREVDDVVRRWRLPARIKVEGDLDHVPGRILSATYVVIREALTNAAKHAPGSNVTVTLTAGPTDLTVTVGDQGGGFTRSDESSTGDSQHFGLDWLRRRVREAGGRLYVHPRPGKGCSAGEAEKSARGLTASAV